MNYDEYVKINPNEISIYDFKGKLTELPEYIFENISAVDILNIDAKNIASFPHSLNKLTVRQSIQFTNNKINQLPDVILLNAHHLKNLHLNAYKVDLSEVLYQFKQLQGLKLDTFKGKQLPQAISELRQLKYLQLHSKIGKKIAHLDLVKLIAESKSLKEVYFNFELDFKQIGDSIISLDNLSKIRLQAYHKNTDFLSIGLLKKASFSLWWNSKPLNKQFQHLVNPHNFSSLQRKILFAVYSNQLNLVNQLVENPFKAFLKNETPFQTIYLSHQLSPSLKKRAKELLQSVSFTTKEGFTKNDIVLFNPETSIEFAIQALLLTQQIATEDQLKEVLIDMESPWLRQKENEDSRLQVQKLILSNQTENILLALEIIDGGGATEEILTMLAVLIMAHPNKIIAKKAEKLFKKLGSSTTYNYIKNTKISLRRSGSTLNKIDRLFYHEVELDEMTFRILHALVAGENTTIKDIYRGTFSLNGEYNTSLPLLIKECHQFSCINLQKTTGILINPSLKTLSHLEHLNQLDMAGCKYEIGTELSLLTKLERLNLSSNQLIDPTCLQALHHLKWLNLEGCSITDWSFVEHLPHLKYLNIGRNKLQEIPKSILNHQGLQELIIKQNQIKVIPDTLAQSNLQKIDLSNNHIEIINYNIFHAKGLRELSLRSNKIKNFEAKKIPSSNVLRSLNLANNALSTFELLPLTFPNLMELDLSKNKLNSLDDSIFKTTNLSNLAASHNQITQLPISISKHSFTHLSLQNNSITELPAFVDTLSVQYFDLRNNNISILHPSITNKKDNYSKLYWKLKGNPISHIPYL